MGYQQCTGKRLSQLRARTTGSIMLPVPALIFQTGKRFMSGTGNISAGSGIKSRLIVWLGLNRFRFRQYYCRNRNSIALQRSS